MRTKLMIILAVATAGCALSPAVNEVGMAGACRGESAQTYVGQLATQEVGSKLLAATGANALRWIAFGQMVTMEYRADRLTVRIDLANRIASATCG